MATSSIPYRPRTESSNESSSKQNGSSNAIPRTVLPLGKPMPYIIESHEGESITIPGTKSVFRILASAAETDGQMSVFGMDGTLADPPGFHYHNHAHDVFMCTKGRLKVWADEKCRILYPGDFAYVPPGVVHQPMLLDHGPNETMGLVTPGDWVDFFRFVSEAYDGVLCDEFDSRNPGAVFGPKIKEIKEKYDVVFQPQFKGAEVGEWEEGECKLPEGQEAYFLKANTGPCHLLEGLLSRPFVTTKQSKSPTGNFSITSIESSNRMKNSVLGKGFVFEKVHQVYYVLDGAISLTVNGEAGNLVRAGETAFIPAGTEVAIEFVDRYVRFWSYASGDGLEALIAEAGGAFEGKLVPDQTRELDTEKVQQVAERLNVKEGGSRKQLGTTA
ncbi:cupin domain-containing protein [Stemphylium lycopersici]|uniref:RmlC-like cupin n=1 Tax=Stemphylium lycopersici TaxID=183478 RepID=A0A364N1R3_STELY|nr:cupin domain-containing protein [Stemphylium lycopersici]RAR09468.1 RmlC-like cupin [Stemphylium lycopersici]